MKGVFPYFVLVFLLGVKPEKGGWMTFIMHTYSERME